VTRKVAHQRRDAITQAACQGAAKRLVASFNPSETAMGINSESDIEANLQIGPTDQGMVRLYVEANGVEIPMDFEPDEAREIAEELLAAAKAAELRKG